MYTCNTLVEIHKFETSVYIDKLGFKGKTLQGA